MKIFKIAILILLMMPALALSQRVGFINSVMIRENLPEAKQADQRIQSIVEEWKREINDFEQQIENLEFEIKKNRLVWTEYERNEKEAELETLITKKEDFVKGKFEPGGEYDGVIKEISVVIETKISAAVRQVAIDKGFDIILDQSEQPIPYLNYKYDLTLSVLKSLGVDVKNMEKDLEKKIEQDPRNQRKESKRPTRRRRPGDTQPDEDQDREIQDRRFLRDEPPSEEPRIESPSENKKINQSKPDSF